jgi:uncharacterized protein (DUF697 family)
MDGLLDILRWIFLLGCVLPTIVMIVLSIAAFYFGKKWIENFIEPDVDKLHNRLVKLRAQKADTNDKKLIGKVIHEQAFKCGIVGAITGFGGFVTLPIALPIDMLLSARFQASMVSFIAQTYGYENEVENKIATYAVMTGSTEVSKVTNRIVLKYAPQFFGKLSSKLIPVLGAVIAFIVNYALTRSMGSAANVWYSNISKPEMLNSDDMSASTA